jgi:hypothetical protein
LIITGGGQQTEVALSQTPRRFEASNESPAESSSGSRDEEFLPPTNPEIWRKDIDFSDIRILIFLGVYVAIMIWAGIDSFRRREV